jgi:phage baseplate assembly protein gpV
MVSARVTAVNDPQGHGRVGIELPWMEGQPGQSTKKGKKGKDQDATFWAPVASPMAGGGRGLWFMPEVGDEVLVSFEKGDVNHPFVVGYLWNGKDKPPSDDPQKRMIKSVNGHTFEIHDPDVQQGDKGHMTMQDAHGNVVTMANGAISVKSVGTLKIDALHVFLNGQRMQQDLVGLSKFPKLCIDFPQAKKFHIPLPFGGALKPIVDPSKGPPTDCALAQSVMMQITPMLAGMECVLRVLKVIQALKSFVTSLNPNDILPAISDLTECFGLVDPTGIAKFIASILRVIIAYLRCFIDAFQSIYNFSFELDITSAGDNPVLLNNINCAKKNAAGSLAAMAEGMGGAASLMEILELLGGVANLPIKFPSLADIAGEEDPLKSIEQLEQVLEELEQILESLPV